jgi:hypothetical protein
MGQMGVTWPPKQGQPFAQYGRVSNANPHQDMASTDLVPAERVGARAVRDGAVVVLIDRQPYEDGAHASIAPSQVRTHTLSDHDWMRWDREPPSPSSAANRLPRPAYVVSIGA